MGRWLAGGGLFVLLYFVLSKGLGAALAGIGHRVPQNTDAITLPMILPRYIGLAIAVIAATALIARWDGREL